MSDIPNGCMPHDAKNVQVTFQMYFSEPETEQGSMTFPQLRETIDSVLWLVNVTGYNTEMKDGDVIVSVDTKQATAVKR